MLNAGKSAEDVCIELHACKGAKVDQRFVSLFGNMV
jgi:hypothetical protein